MGRGNDFVDVTLWGRTAEVASEYLTKGSPVLIEGRLKLDYLGGQRRPEAVEAPRGGRANANGGRPRRRWRSAGGGSAAVRGRAATRPQAAAGRARGGPPDDDFGDMPPAGALRRRRYPLLSSINISRNSRRIPMPQSKSKKRACTASRAKRLPKAPSGGIELLLIQAVEHLGQQGDVVAVRPGYAMNYLLPQGLATIATEHHKRMVEKHRAQLEQIEKARLAGLRALADELGRQSVTIEANANDEGHLYGSVGAAGHRQRPETQQDHHRPGPGPLEGR